MAFLKAIGWAALVAGVWFLAAYGQGMPQPLGLDAPLPQFSAARSIAALHRLLDPEQPHPVGSAQDDAVRERLLHALAAMGVPAQVQTRMGCFGEPRWGALSCGTVHNVVAQVTAGAGPRVMMMAHMDSVAAGAGACDDGCGMAVLLETIRTLKDSNFRGAHPVMALITDGEEAGMLGAAAWVKGPHPPIGAVVNVDNRGNSGRSHLFQTGPGNGPLIDLYARVMPYPAASSLYGEIFKFLPNDTDFTPLLQAGLTGVNFAAVGHLAHYHTRLDRIANIAPDTLQQQGEGALDMAVALANSDFAQLHGGDAVYLDVLGRWLPRLPQNWALPLSVSVLALIVLAAMLTSRGERETARPLSAAIMPLLLALGAVAAGFLLHGIAAWISGNADPSFAVPVWLRWSLGAGVFAVTLAMARGAGLCAGWIWFGVLGVVSALWAPGATPYFLFPALVAAPLLLLPLRGGRTAALFVAGLIPLVLWMSLNVAGEDIEGLKLHPLFTVSMALALVPLLPLLKVENWKACAGVAFAVALVLAVVAGFQPAFTATSPQRLNLHYLQDGGKAWWVADPVARLPSGLRAIFPDRPADLAVAGYAVAAPPAKLPVPHADVTRQGNRVMLDLHGTADGIYVLVPSAAKLRNVSIGDANFAVAPSPHGTGIACATPDCEGARMTLTLADPHPVLLKLEAMRRGLVPGGAKLPAARPAEASPSGLGDTSIVMGSVAVPGG